MTRQILPIATTRDTWRAARALLGPHRAALLLTVAAFCVVGLAQLVGPWFMGRTVDEVAAGTDGSEARILEFAIWIVAAAVVAGLATLTAQTALARATEPALAELREEVLDRVLHLDYQQVEEAGAGDLLSRVGDDVRTIGRSLESVVPMLIGSVVAVVFTAGGLFALDWRLGLAGLTAAPFYVLGLRWYLPRSGPFYQRQRIAQGERSEAMVAGLHGAATLRAFSLEASQTAHIRTASWKAAQIGLDVFGMLTRFFARNNRAECVGLLAVLGTGFLLVRDDAASVGEVTAAALFFHRLFNPIGALVVLFDEVQSAGASLARLAGVAQLPRPAEATPRMLPEGDFEARDLHHEYVAGRPVLDDVNVRIAPDERVAVVGASGAGKTTLGAILAGVLAPTRGQVSASGTTYDDLGRGPLRRRIMLVSQDVHVFSGTVRDAVTLVDPDAADEEVRAALETALSWSWVAALPDGLDTVIGEHGHHLTPTQAQQLALARVALHDPRLVVLDEATAEAGSSGARELEAAALAVTHGRAALVIAHRLSQAATADRVLVMDEGRIIEQGPHSELVRRGGRYAELWSAWTALS